MPLFPRDHDASAFGYLSCAVLDELVDRVPSRARRETVYHRLNAIMRLYSHIQHPYMERRLKLEQ